MITPTQRDTHMADFAIHLMRRTLDDFQRAVSSRCAIDIERYSPVVLDLLDAMKQYAANPELDQPLDSP